MLPFTPTTLEETFKNFSSYYIAHNGLDKYNKIYEKVQKSDKIAVLDGWSIRNKQAATAKDYLATINSIPYFIFASSETCALAAIMAIRLWSERINKVYHFVTEEELSTKIQSIFRILKIQ